MFLLTNFTYTKKGAIVCHISILDISILYMTDKLNSVVNETY